MPVDTDAIGDRGESIVTSLLLRRYGQPRSRFRPQFLGEKYPTVDFIVELVGAEGNHVPFFFAQVKATSTGYDAHGRLKVKVPRDKLAGLVRYPAPTYVFGVDEVGERAFIVAAQTGGAVSLSSVRVDYPLDEAQTLQDLYNEVQTFWQDHPTLFTSSRFT